MINLTEHIVEIEGKKYVPFDIAVKALNNSYSDNLDKIGELQVKLVKSIKNISNIDLDD